MSDGKIKTTAFIPVFRDKLDKIRNQLKDEYKRARSERRKEAMKKLAREAKSLKKLVDQADDQKDIITCPNCGHKLSQKN